MTPIAISIIWILIGLAVVYYLYRILRPFTNETRREKIAALVIIFLIYLAPAVDILIRHIH